MVHNNFVAEGDLMQHVLIKKDFFYFLTTQKFNAHKKLFQNIKKNRKGSVKMLKYQLPEESTSCTKVSVGNK